MLAKEELDYLARCKQSSSHVIQAVEGAKQEGFHYLFSTYLKTPKQKLAVFKEKFFSNFKVTRIFMHYIFRIRKDQKRSFKSLIPYFEEFNSQDTLYKLDTGKNSPEIPKNPDLWEELNLFVRERWSDVRIGFTKLPPELIFKDKAVLFPYALVVLQEMKKDKIDLAPDIEAGNEVFRVYTSLGIIVNKIADWFRDHNIRAQSNHPIGGLVCTPPLAGKAGLGWQGRNGCLITPEFGPRCRIAPVFIESPIFTFTDNDDHRWIEQYCEKCGLCQKNCPANAIYAKKQIAIPNVAGIGAMRTCIDREKCFPYFNRTLGCSICLKVCPFSNGNYEKLKKVILKSK